MIAVGFELNPSGEDLINCYLYRWIKQEQLPCNVIPVKEIDTVFPLSTGAFTEVLILPSSFMGEVYLGMERTESLIMPCVATHAPENSTAAMLENILTRFARIETRLIEHERRAAATLPPLRTEPDPPDGTPFYTASQPPYPPYQPPLLPYQPDNYLPLSPYTYTTSLLHQTHQPPLTPNNSIGHQPYTTFDAAAQPQPYLHHPSHPPCSGPDPYVQQCLPDAGYPPWQPEYQPPRPLPFPDRLPTAPHSTSCWSPPSHHRSAALLPAVAAAPPPPQLRSGSTHPPQQPKKFIDYGRQHGLTNNPNLSVRSPSPAQLAAVSDYNEKLRVHRLDQAALLARVTAWFEKNIDDENIAEENSDDDPTMILSENVPEDINDVPNNATHNDGAILDVPHDEFVEEIVKNDENGSLKASSPRHALECVQIAPDFCENINITAKSICDWWSTTENAGESFCW